MEALEARGEGRELKGGRLAILKGKFAFIRSGFYKKKKGGSEGEKREGCTICSPSLIAPNDNLLCISVNVQGGGVFV